MSLSVFSEYEHILEDVWTISPKRLSLESRETLNVAAFLNPDEIQHNMLQRLVDDITHGDGR